MVSPGHVPGPRTVLKKQRIQQGSVVLRPGGGKGFESCSRGKGGWVALITMSLAHRWIHAWHSCTVAQPHSQHCLHPPAVYWHIAHIARCTPLQNATIPRHARHEASLCHAPGPQGTGCATAQAFEPSYGGTDPPRTRRNSVWCLPSARSPTATGRGISCPRFSPHRPRPMCSWWRSQGGLGNTWLQQSAKGQGVSRVRSMCAVV